MGTSLSGNPAVLRGHCATGVGLDGSVAHNKTPVFWNRGLSADDLRFER